LEHLIFTGSKDYPDRGYLDKLATICLSTGTNAYTSEDHTCYFVSTASLDGLVKLLPVYLDHILHPQLRPEDMALEVFSLDPASKEARGVVYCEMKSREHTEADQLDIRLRNMAFEKGCSEDSYLETYRWECGGSTSRVSHLTPEEIRAYHAKYYRPENITIFFSGQISSAEEETVWKALNAFTYESKPDCEDSSVLETLKETAPEPVGCFPADDESIGSIGFSWLGPPSSDLRSVMALHILLRSLRDTTASPLYQEFVECSDPCASDIDYDVRGSKKTLISLVFSGVPTEHDEDGNEQEESASESENEDEFNEGSKLEPGLIKDRMFAVFKQLLGDDQTLMKIVKNTIRSFTMKIQEQYQEDPHELAFGYCLPEILNNGSIGNAITCLPEVIRSLDGEDVTFWKYLFNTYLVDGDCHEAIMHPSKDMAEQVKKAEQDNLSLVEERDVYPKSGAALLEKFSGSVSCDFAFPAVDIDLIRNLSVSQGFCMHIIRLPSTAFNVVTIGFNVKRTIDPELWPYLVLFQELLFQCDIEIPESVEQTVLPSGKTSYQDLQRKLASMFTSHEAGMGLGNELFSASHLDSHLIMSATCPADSQGTHIPSAVELLLLVLKFSQFTAERISVTVDNLVSQLADCKRDPSTVIDAVFSQETANVNFSDLTSAAAKRPKKDVSRHVSSAVNIFTQEPVLRSIKDDGVPDDLIDKLNHISSALLGNLVQPDSKLHAFIHVGAGINEGNNWDDETSMHQVVRAYSKIAEYQIPTEEVSWSLEPRQNHCSFPAPERLPRYAHLAHVPLGNTVVVPMADVTASYMACSVFLPLLPVNDGQLVSFTNEALMVYLSLAMFCNMLSFTEGPLYNRIRGKGLAYGAYLSLSLWNGLLSFDLNDSTAPVEAFHTFLQMIREVMTEFDEILSGNTDTNMLCEATLQAAKATFAFSQVSDRSTPSNIFSLALRSAIRGGYPAVYPAEQAALMTMLRDLSLADMARIVKPIVGKFLAPQNLVTICVVPPSMQQTIFDGLTELNLAPSIQALHL